MEYTITDLYNLIDNYGYALLRIIFFFLLVITIIHIIRLVMSVRSKL